MIFHHVEPGAFTVEAQQAGWGFVAEAGLLQGLGAAADRPEFHEPWDRVCRPFPADRLLEGGIGREQIHVLERRALVENLMRLERLEHAPAPLKDSLNLATLAGWRSPPAAFSTARREGRLASLAESAYRTAFNDQRHSSRLLRPPPPLDL